jgi:hypothetical protein
MDFRYGTDLPALRQRAVPALSAAAMTATTVAAQAARATSGRTGTVAASRAKAAIPAMRFRETCLQTRT